MSQHENLILDHEIVVGSFGQEMYIASIKLLNDTLDNLWHLIVAALAGYAVYLAIVFGTPATPVAAASNYTAEQTHESFGESMGVIVGIATLALSYANWRKLLR